MVKISTSKIHKTVTSNVTIWKTEGCTPTSDRSNRNLAWWSTWSFRRDGIQRRQKRSGNQPVTFSGHKCQDSKCLGVYWPLIFRSVDQYPKHTRTLTSIVSTSTSHCRPVVTIWIDFGNLTCLTFKIFKVCDENMWTKQKWFCSAQLTSWWLMWLAESWHPRSSLELACMLRGCGWPSRSTTKNKYQQNLVQYQNSGAKIWHFSKHMHNLFQFNLKLFWSKTLHGILVGFTKLLWRHCVEERAGLMYLSTARPQSLLPVMLVSSLTWKKTQSSTTADARSTSHKWKPHSACSSSVSVQCYVNRVKHIIKWLYSWLITSCSDLYL